MEENVVSHTAEQLEAIHNFCMELIDVTACYLNILISANLEDT